MAQESRNAKAAAGPEKGKRSMTGPGAGERGRVIVVHIQTFRFCHHNYSMIFHSLSTRNDGAGLFRVYTFFPNLNSWLQQMMKKPKNLIMIISLNFLITGVMISLQPVVVERGAL